MEYKIPEEILSKIPEYFWAGLAGELVSIYSLSIFDVCEGGVRWIDFHTGTNGWNVAFKTACKKMNMMWLYTYYDELLWWESDKFDGEITELLISKFIEVEMSQPSPYYLWAIEE